MKRASQSDLLIVGAGPTGLAIGAEARMRGLDVELIDQGPLCSSVLAFPRDMVFFTTRDKLEIGGIPFAIPDSKPTRRQAMVYYQSVARAHQLSVNSYERAIACDRVADGFEVRTEHLRTGDTLCRFARGVVLATGYFEQPKQLGVVGEDVSWVSVRYDEPLLHYGENVVVIGGGNSGCEAALDLWRSGARVTLVHRSPQLKPTVKYWLKPDVENRIAEGDIEALLDTEVVAFEDRSVVVESKSGQRQVLPADAAYVLIGYLPDVELERRFGVEVDPETLVPTFDSETCESNVEGIYLAGTIQAGRDTGKIFIENSRAHAPRIVDHFVNTRARTR